MNLARPNRTGPGGFRARALACVLGLAVAAAAPALAAPPAGTPIPNTAEGRATDSLSGAVLSRQSNTVTTVVQPLERGTLETPRSRSVAPGGAATFAHELVNLGNVASDFRFDAVNLAGDDFDAAAIALVRDLDGDGLVGPGDLPIAPGDALTLAAGDSTQLLLTVTTPANAPPRSVARVRLTALTSAQGATMVVVDTVYTTGALVPPSLAFYSGDDFARTVRATALGAPLFVAAHAPQCDTDPSRPDTVTLRLSSRVTGDVKQYAAVETGNSTGIFVVRGVPVVTPSQGPEGSGSGALRQARGDLVTAELFGCGATHTQADVWIEPGGTVFDSHTNAPVPGARVQLVDVSGAGNGSPGGLAIVWQNDGVTPAPAEVYTNGAGRFAFPIVPASTYRLDVVPPSPWTYPSLVTATGLPAGHELDPDGSFGAAFVVATPNSPILVDLPVDAHGTVTLFAEKTASVTRAEWGDDVGYRVRVANRSDSLLAAPELRDVLPAGFALVPGTVSIGANPASDPARAAGTLVFALGALGPNREIEVHYRVRIGPGAPAGDAVNTAVAWSGATHSNAATASVRVQGDAFADEGTIVGRVGFASGGPDVPGLAGVRLYLDDGTYAITDAEGRFSFAQVTPRTHALKLDASTLPAGARVEARSHRDGDRPGVRFVDLTRGELVSANFTVAGDSTVVRELAERHRLAVKLGADERARIVARGVAALAAGPAQSDPRALPAERITTGESTLPVYDALAGSAAPPARPAVGRAADPAALEQQIAALTPELAFVGLSDPDTVTTNQVAVVVKGPAGTTLELRVNGEKVPESRVDRRFTAARTGLVAWEYLGVALRPGLNVLEIAPPGVAAHRTLRLVAPGPFARLGLAGPRTRPADGHGVTELVLTVTDAAGVPVGDRTLVTLDSPLAPLRADDLDPATPGVQVAVEGGQARVRVGAPSSPARARITAAAGEARTSMVIEFVPELRPLLAVGAAEGIVSLRSLARAGALVRGMPSTGFEAPIDQFLSTSRDERTSAGAHGAVFVKGRVGDRALLTLGYDSDRPADQRQFRDQQPDRGYAVVGDASTRGYDAQSTGHLYARLEQREGSVVYGDFLAGAGTDSRVLGHYSRSLTGASAQWHGSRGELTGFTSRGRSHQAVDELRGNGTSGPYTLAHLPMVENSERVEIVVRDRAQPAIVLSTTTRERFTDYELETLTGRLLFRSPVPSVDAELNPVSVRVTYELEDGTPAWVNGVDGRVAVNRTVELGGTWVDDHDAAAPFELRGASATVHLAPRATLDAEWASTHRQDAGTGEAGRVELRVENPGVQARLYGMSSARAFQNPGSGFAAGRAEAGARVSVRLADRTHLGVEGLFSSGGPGQEHRSGFLLALDRALNDALRGELGVRWSQAQGGSTLAAPASTAARAKLSAQLPAHPAWSGYAEAEQDTRQLDRRMAALGGEYRFSARGRLYTRHELTSSLTSAWAMTTSQQQAASVVGVDADLSRDAHVFSEYRLNDALAGREAQAAVGLRNAWALDGGIRLGTSFERVEPLRGSTAGASTALTGSLDYAGEAGWKGSARTEVRTSRTSDQFLQSMGGAFQLDSCWTGLTRYLLTVNDQHAAGCDDRLRLQLAFAYRTGASWDALGRWDFSYEQQAAPSATTQHLVANVVGLNATGRTRGWETSLGWAGKLTRSADDAVTAGGAQWLRARCTRDLGRAWDLGASASVLAGRRFAQRQYGLGLELGRMLPGGTWASLGFNQFGYVDDLLTNQEWTRQGAYLRVRVKFDELLLQPSATRHP